MARLWIILAGTFGIAAVVGGAWAAHGAENILTATQITSMNTAMRYLMYHALGLFMLGVAMRHIDVRRGLWHTVGILWTTGAALFSGSIVLLIFFGWSWLGPITPLGGVLLILGWAMLIIAGVMQRGR